MKKSALILCTCVPILAGYVINWSVLIPVIGWISCYVLPLLVLAFWFALGGRYAKANWKLMPSLVVGSATGVLSLCLYLWQFWGESGETRNMAIAGFSQMYSAATPQYLFAGLAMMFESQPNYVGPTTFLMMQVISLVLMTAVFGAGYIWEKRHGQKKI